MSEIAVPSVRPESPLGDPEGRLRPRSAVVLAAGLSTRMGGAAGHGSKALMRLGGVPLVERVVRRLLDLGVENVFVVVGAHVRPVTAFVDAIAPGRVRAIHADDWRLGNGASLAATESYLSDEQLFLCVTTDHLFGEGSLEPLLTAGRPAVLVDHAPSPEVWAEGTRVRLVGDNAVAFSKELTNPAVDCGAFLLSPAVFEAQRAAAGEGDHSLAGAVSRLADRRPLAAVPLPAGAWWFDLDTPADVRAARRAYRRSLVKASDGPVARYLNRPVSTRISMAIVRFRPHPDVLSMIAFLVGLAGAWLLWDGSGLVAAVVVQLASVLDGVDGEAARLQHRARPQGALLDGVLDRLADAAIAAGLAGWALSSGDASEVIAIVLAVAATALSLLSMATKDRISSLGLTAAPERGLNLLLGGRDGRLLLVAMAAVVAKPVWGLAAIVVTCGLSLILRLAFVLREASARPLP